MTNRKSKTNAARRARAATLVLAALLCSSGCGGPSTTRVWGEVSLNGVPVEEGTIEFTPVEGTLGPSTGGPIQQGRYDIPGRVGPLANGTYQVAIRSIAKTGKKGPHPLNRAEQVDLFANIIPPAYNSKTTLKVHISDRADENQHDFPLKK